MLQLGLGLGLGLGPGNGILSFFFFFLLCKCGGHHLLCSSGAWPALSMSHVSMTSSGMKRGGSPISTPPEGAARGRCCLYIKGRVRCRVKAASGGWSYGRDYVMMNTQFETVTSSH